MFLFIVAHDAIHHLSSIELIEIYTHSIVPIATQGDCKSPFYSILFSETMVPYPNET